jgi:hypothetical protein
MAWNADGERFEVKDRDLLSDVLAEHFRHRKFSSFQRQLNYFGFKHVGRGVYSHPSFVRGNRDAALQISRKTRPKAKDRIDGLDLFLKAKDLNFDKDLNIAGLAVPVPEDSILLDFLPAEQHSPSSLDMAKEQLKQQIASSEKDRQWERQRKLQLRLQHHLQQQCRVSGWRGHGSGFRGGGEESAYLGVGIGIPGVLVSHEGVGPQGHEHLTAAKTNVSHPQMFQLHSKSNSAHLFNPQSTMQELQYQVQLHFIKCVFSFSALIEFWCTRLPQVQPVEYMAQPRHSNRPFYSVSLVSGAAMV